LVLFVGLGPLKKYAASQEGQAHKTFYDEKIASVSRDHALLNGYATREDKQGYFAASTDLWIAIKAFVVETLPAGITVGPFISGAHPGVDDFHVGAWIARIAFVLGAQKSEEGVAVLEKNFGPLPEKVKAYWGAWITRDSWVKTYPDHVLH
jgi:hypothetical protein